MPVGTFISVGRSLDSAVERVRLAERLGYNSAYTTHIAGRDSLTVLAAYAAATERLVPGTGVLPIYSRTPVATAQAEASVRRYLDAGATSPCIGAIPGTDFSATLEALANLAA